MEGSWVAIFLPPLLFKLGVNPATSLATVVIWLFCLGLFFWSWYTGRARSGRLRSDLAEFASIIEEVRAGRLGIDSVAGRLSSRANPTTIGLWRDFEATLLRVPQEDGGLRVYSTVPAKFVLHEEAFSEGTRLQAVVPSLLTGLGILGTFLGLSLGLTNVNLASEELGPLKEGLRSLLSGAHMAFITSVWGIGLSIVLIWLQKKYSGWVSGELNRICDLLDGTFPRKPAEVWLSEVHREAREQTAELKKFNDELAWNIAAALDEKLAVRLTPALENLLAAIDRLTKAGSTEIARVISREAGAEVTKLGEVLQQASNVLNGVLSASSELQRIVGETVSRQLALTVSHVEESLGSSAARFAELAGQVERAVDQVRQAVADQISWQKRQFEELLGRVQDTTKGYLEEFLAKVNHALGTVSERSGHVVSEVGERIYGFLEELSGRVKELGEEYASRREEMRSALDEITALLAVMERLVKEAAAVLDGYRESAQPVREAGTLLAKSVESVANAGATLRQATLEFKGVWDEYRRHSARAVEEIKQALMHTENAWRAYEARFGQLRQDLEAVFETLRTGLSDYNKVVYEGITGCLRELDGEMGKAIGSLGAGVAELKDTLEDFTDFLEDLTGFLEQLNRGK